MVGRDNGLRQDDYIYGLHWDVNVVTLFIEVLADQARMGKFMPNSTNRQAVQTAQYVVNKFFDKNFELIECFKQVHLLSKRHVTFSKLMLRDDLTWNEETNEVACNDDTWAEIVRADPFAWTYAKYGDPHWEDFQVLYGLPAKPAEASPPVEDGHKVNVIEDEGPHREFRNTYTPLNEVIVISSDKSGSLSTNFWNELGDIGGDSDDDGLFLSHSLKTEMSSSNPTLDAKAKGKGKNKFGDNICMSLYGASYKSSSSHASPNSKK